MIEMRSEFLAIARAALAGDTGLASLTVVGRSAAELTWTVQSGPLPNKIAGHEWRPSVPFERQHVVDLIGTMIRKRWSRYDDFLLTLRTPNHDDRIAIEDKWSHRSLHSGGGPGWLDLIDATMQLAESVDPDQWRVFDVKEKFGTLRWSAGTSLDGDGAFEASEHVSAFVCDCCGAPGRLREGGWVTTRCDEHAENKR